MVAPARGAVSSPRAVRARCAIERKGDCPDRSARGRVPRGPIPPVQRYGIRAPPADKIIACARTEAMRQHQPC